MSLLLGAAARLTSSPASLLGRTRVEKTAQEAEVKRVDLWLWGRGGFLVR